MKVLFLEVDTQSDWAVASLGPAFIGAYIRQFGHEASLFRVPVSMGKGELVEVVRAHSPDVIGVSLTSRQWQRAKSLLTHLRSELDTPVVVGGLHPTFSPTDTLEQPGVDYVCLGEGEKPMLYLLEALAAGGPVEDGLIPNIWVKGGQRPVMGKPFEPIDQLPFMARDLLDERYGVVHMATQRGCPFPCTYCAARMYDELYSEHGHNYGRRRSHSNVLDELFAIRDDGPLNYVIFLDDTFTIHHPWVKEFCKLYGKRLRVPFSLHARVETINETMIGELADAGCRHITYGVESGSLRVRREVMKRPVSDEKLIKAFQWTRRAGILVTANYMMGIPGETREDLQMTVDLHDRLEPDDFGFFVFYPYPGTHMFKYCLENGYLPEDYLNRPANHRESILNLPDLTQDDIAEYYDRWTKVRSAHVLKRYGPGLSPEQKELTVDLIEQCASTG